MYKNLIVWLALCVFVGAAHAQDAPLKLAKIVAVESEAPALARQFFGQVAAKETVELAFQVGGQIVEAPIVEGQVIAKGGLIAKLDLEPFELALDQARVQKEQAERVVERFQRLQGSSVSQVTVDDAETQLQLATIAERDAARSLRNATLLAPFDALVAARNVANFTTIGAGTSVVRLHDMSELRVEIDVPEVLFQRAGEDPDVDLFAKFPASEQQFPLGVREFNAETSQVGQTFRITLGMPPPENLVVLPGSSVTVFATLHGGQSGVTIPQSAIVAADDGTTHVMVFSPAGAEDGTVAMTPVEISPDADGRMRVLNGLEAGQEIVASGANMLKDGERVRRFTGFSN